MNLFGLFNKRKSITINIKLLAGLDKIQGYNPNTGMELKVPEGIKLKKALKQIELPKDQPISYIVNGEKAGADKLLQNGDQIFCFLPFAGG